MDGLLKNCFKLDKLKYFKYFWYEVIIIKKYINLILMMSN